MMRIRWLKWLAAAVWFGGNVLVAFVMPPRPRATLPVRGGQILRAFTPDGRSVLTATAYQMQLWDVTDGREVHSVKRTQPEKPFPKDLVISPDCRHILGCSGPFTEVVLLDLATGKEVFLAQFAGLYPSGMAGQFSPDGRFLAFATIRPVDQQQPFRLGPAQDSVQVVVWDVAAGAERFRLPAAMGPVAFSPDGRTLATAAIKTGETRDLRLWDTDTGALRGAVLDSERIPSIGSGRSMTRLTFSPDGRGLLVGVKSWPHVMPVPLIFNLDDGSQHELVESLDVEWLADGGLVTVAPLFNGRYEIREWDRHTGSPCSRWSLPDRSWRSTGGGWPTLSADGRLLMSQWTVPVPAWQQWLLERLRRLRLPFIEARSVINLWDAPTGRHLGELDAEGRRLGQAPDGRTFVTFGPTGSLMVWDVPPARPWPLFLAALTAQTALAVVLMAWRRRRSARQKLAAVSPTR